MYSKRKIEFHGIVAMTADETIGVDEDLPWKMGEQKLDMKRFRQFTTEGGIVIMGRKTWESMGRKSLPKRFNIIVTTQTGYPHDENSMLAHSMEEAVTIAESFGESSTDGKSMTAYFIGGSDIYRQAMLMSLISVFHVSYIGRYLHISPTSVYVKFPLPFPISEWDQEREEFFPADEGNLSAGRFIDYVNKDYAALAAENEPTAERAIEGDNGWINVADGKPTEYGKFEVYRAKSGKQHYQTWNGTGWAYDNADITHWRVIVPPKAK
jgi:dihydrofolate reductase